MRLTKYISSAYSKIIKIERGAQPQTIFLKLYFVKI